MLKGFEVFGTPPDKPSKPSNAPVDDAALQQKISLMEAALDAAKVEHSELKPYTAHGKTGWKFDLVSCPFSDAHTTQTIPGGAIVIIHDDGVFGFSCCHGHCADKTWKEDVRPELEKIVGHKLSFSVASTSAPEPATETGIHVVADPPKVAVASDKSKPAGTSLPRLPLLVCASDIKPRKIEWLWDKRVPLGKLTLFAGNPDNAKSLCATSLAAICSAGGTLPHCGESIVASKVLLMIGEDEKDDTAVPRLIAAGANRDNIIFFEGVRTDKDGEIRLDEHMDVLVKTLTDEPQFRLLIIDPVSNYLGAKSMNGEQDVRSVLIPLREAAAKHGVAVILVMHLNKKADLDAINRVGGAMAFLGVCRCSWLFARDEKNPDGTPSKNFSMTKIKNNLTAVEHGGIAYTVEVASVPTEDGPAITPYVVWGDEMSKTADAVLIPEKSVGAPASAEGPAADEWLIAELAAGPLKFKEVKDLNEHGPGFSTKILRGARERVCAKTYKIKDDWWLKLKPEYEPAPAPIPSQEGI